MAHEHAKLAQLYGLAEKPEEARRAAAVALAGFRGAYGPRCAHQVAALYPGLATNAAP